MIKPGQEVTIDERLRGVPGGIKDLNPPKPKPVIEKVAKKPKKKKVKKTEKVEAVPEVKEDGTADSKATD